MNPRIRLALAAVLSLSLVACAQDPGFFELEPSQTAQNTDQAPEESIGQASPAPYDGYAIPKTMSCKPKNEGAMAGAVVGGLVGGFIGNQIPENKEDKAQGTALGALVGVVIGSMIGSSADEDSEKCQPMDGVLEDSLKVIKDPDSLEA